MALISNMMLSFTYLKQEKFKNLKMKHKLFKIFQDQVNSGHLSLLIKQLESLAVVDRKHQYLGFVLLFKKHIKRLPGDLSFLIIKATFKFFKAIWKYIYCNCIYIMHKENLSLLDKWIYI